MSVLITGGSGLVGTCVARYLAEQGTDVILYDIVERHDGYLDSVADRITFIEGSVMDFAYLNQVVREQSGLTGIVHAVALLGYDARERPHFASMTNIGGTLNVLEVVRQTGNLRVVYVSSGAVYGRAEGQLSEDRPMKPSDPYGATKAASEHMCYQYHETFGVDVLAARLFFVYGPPNTPGPDAGFNTKLFASLSGQKDVELPRGREQKGDWTYTKDAAHGIAQMLEVEHVKDRVFNIATGTFNPIDEIVAMIRQHTPDANIQVGPGVNLERGAPLDITRAREQLGFEPQYDLKAGIKDYAEWFASK